MKLHFLGVPQKPCNPFPLWTLSKKQENLKDIRTHFSAIVDDIMLIDVSPTFSYQLMRDGMDATNFESLPFLTHPDHFNVGDLFSQWKVIVLKLTISSYFGNDRD